MFSTLFKIIKWCDSYKKRLYMGFLYSMLSIIFIAMPTMLAAYVLTMVIKDYQNIEKLNSKWILYSLILMIVFVFFRFLFDYLRAKNQESISYELLADNRLKIGEVLKKVSLGYFKEKNTGEIVNAITTGLNLLENMGIRMVDSIVGAYINIFIVIVTMFLFDIRFGVVILCGTIISTFLLIKISSCSKTDTGNLLKVNNDLSSSIVEVLRGISVIKTFGKNAIAINNIKNACSKSKKINCKIEMGFTPFNILNMVVLKITSVILILVAFTMYINNSIPIIVLMATILFSFSVFSGIEALPDAAHIMGVIENSFIQMESLLSEKYYIEGNENIDLKRYDIDFNNVTFSYDKTKIIDNINLHIKEGTITAIVGPSGSGKTTLCNLLARFYKIDSGNITIGKTNIERLSQDSLMKNLSIVFQDVYLFNDSVLNNIKFSNPNASYDTVVKIAKKACCHDFIMQLPKGYDTVIGEAGNTLSGGQKQRISIARAMLKDSPIIILDEATASVDPENEVLIQSALRFLTKNKTVIIIAHRLATIQNADNIVVLENGKIIEMGTHKMLLQNNGLYKSFLDIKKKSEGWMI